MRSRQSSSRASRELDVVEVEVDKSQKTVEEFKSHLDGFDERLQDHKNSVMPKGVDV